MNIQPEEFTTAAVRHDYGLENNMIAIGARIENKDPTNTCTVRVHSRNGTARVIPVSTALAINEWFQEIHIEPHGITGTGTLQVELVRPEDARR